MRRLPARVSGGLNRIAEPVFYHPSGLRGALGGRLLARIWGRNAVNLLRHLQLAPDATVLEVGPGPGVGIAEAARLAPAGRIVGLDASATMIGQAQRRNAGLLSEGRGALVRGVATALPFPAASFDVVVSLSSLPFWGDAAAGLAEIYRVLASGGRIGIGINPPAAWPVDQKGLERMIAQAGFRRMTSPHVRSITMAVVAERPAEA